MKTNKSKKFRRKLLIYPKFQVTILLFNFVIQMMLFFTINFVINGYFNQMRKLGEDASFPVDHTYFKFIALQEGGLESSFLQIAFWGLVFSTIGFLILSHKISGPLVRLRSFFTSIANNQKVEKISFRERDFFSELPNLINEAFRSVSSEDKLVKEDSDEINNG